LLATRGVTISVNTSSNLRLRSGVAPLARFLQSGVALGLGLDGMALDDDDDALREMRLAFLMHARERNVTPRSVFTAAMGTGRRAVTGVLSPATIAPGGDADLVFLDYQAMAGDVVEDLTDESLLVLGRASGRFVTHLMVNGRWVLRDGHTTGIDEARLNAE